MELKQDKVYYDVKTKHREVNFNEDELVHIKQKTKSNIDTLRLIEEDNTDTNIKIFSIRCASKTDYYQLAEIYRNHEVFQKARELIKQEKDEKITKLRKELQLIDPEMDITSKKKKTTECNDNIPPVIQKQQKPNKVQQHDTKKTANKKGAENSKVVSRRALASRKNKIKERISRKYKMEIYINTDGSDINHQ